MDCSLPGSSVHGILQAKILEWFAMSSSRESSQPRDQSWVSGIAGGIFTTETPGKPNKIIHLHKDIQREFLNQPHLPTELPQLLVQMKRKFH